MSDPTADRATETAIVECQDLRLAYGQAQALTGVDFSIRAGEQLAIMGQSGSGKSSLLYCIAGLELPTSGDVLLNGRSLTSLSDAERSSERLAHIGLVFQSSELVSELTLFENMALSLQLLGWPKSRVRARCEELVDDLGLSECRDRRPHQVSGGQRQRAAIARAVAAAPGLILADEPTGALDSESRESVLGLLLDTARSVNASLVVVTHDSEVARRLERNVTLADGKIIDDTQLSGQSNQPGDHVVPLG